MVSVSTVGEQIFFTVRAGIVRKNLIFRNAHLENLRTIGTPEIEQILVFSGRVALEISGAKALALEFILHILPDLIT